MKVDSETKVGISVVVFAIVAFVAALGGILGENNIVLSFVVAIANIVMAGVIALQAVSMNESVLEMKKERMNIEEFKNSLIAYLRYIRGELKLNSTSTKYRNIKEPYQYILERYHRRISNDLSPSEVGLVWRISVFIKRFLEVHGFSWQELDNYHDLIRRFKDSNTPRDEKPKLANEIREKSKELGKIVEDILHEIEEMGNQKFEEEILKILES